MEQEEILLPRKRLLTEGDKKFIQISCGSLIAVDFLLMQCYLSRTQLDNCERTAMYCFAAAIPFLVAYAFAAKFIIVECKSIWTWLGVAFLGGLAMIVNIGGIMSAFWHFSPEIGELFFASSTLALMFFGKVFLPVPKR